MSFIGKLLVVMQLVLSICLMAFAAAVSSYQTNWKAKSESVQKQLDQQRADYAKLEQERKNEADQFNKRLLEEQEKARESGVRVTQLTQQVQTLQGEQRRLNEESERKTQINTDLADDSTARQDEAKLLRAKLKLALDDRDKEYKAKADLEDTIFEQSTKIERLTTQTKSLLLENKQFKDVLIAKGLPTEIEEHQKLQAPAEKVEGRVREVRVASNGGDTLIEISLGENDGLRKKHELFIYSLGEQAKFKGKATVLDVTADSAICRVYQKSGTIEKDDHVTTRLQ